MIETLVPDAYDPPPEPLVTVSAYNVGGAALYVAVTLVAFAGIVSVVEEAFTFVIVGDPEFATHLSNTCPAGAALTVIVTLVPAAYDPLPEPLVTVSANVCALYVAVTLAAFAGIVSVVEDAFTSVMVGDPEFATHLSKTCPAGTVLAVIVTLVPAAYDPPPEPLVTVSANVCALYVAVTLTAFAGMVSVVEDAFTSVIVGDPEFATHLSNT